METTQKESPQNQNVLRIHGREGGREHTAAAKYSSAEGFTFPGILLQGSSSGSTPQMYNLNRKAEQQAESERECLLEQGWTPESGSQGMGTEGVPSDKWGRWYL